MLTTTELETAAQSLAYNFKSRDGYMSYIDQDELPDGPEAWTVVSFADPERSEDLIAIANGVAMAKELHQWMTGEFVDFFNIPEDVGDVYMDVPDKSAGVLVRIKNNGEFTKAFIYIVESANYISNRYPLLPDAESIHEELEAAAAREYLRNHFYSEISDEFADEDWVPMLASIASDYDMGLAELQYDLWEDDEDGEGFWGACMFSLLAAGYLHDSAVEDFLQGRCRVASGSIVGDLGVTVSLDGNCTHIPFLSPDELEKCKDLEHEQEQAALIIISRKLYLSKPVTSDVQLDLASV